MSKDQDQPTVSDIYVVREIAAFLKIGDVGKLDNAFKKIVKHEERANDALKKKIANADFNYGSKKIELDYKLEDAQDCLKTAYTNIDIEDLKSNVAIDTLRKKYLANLDNCCEAIDSVEEEKKELKEALDSEIEGYQDQIDARAARIKHIKLGK